MAASYYNCIRQVCHDTRDWRVNNNHVPDTYNKGCEYDASKLIVPIAGDVIDLPFFGIDDYYLILKNNLLAKHPKYNTIYYPLVSNRARIYRYSNIKESYKSAVPAIKAWFCVAKTMDGLVPIKIGDTQYYGNSGILLNENKELLLLMTVTLQKVIKDKEIAYKVVNPNIYVDTRVFTEEGVLHKHIKQKLLTEVFKLRSTSFTSTVLRNRLIVEGGREIKMDFKVIIDDLSYWTTKPSVPAYTDTSEVMNKWLAETLVIPKVYPTVEE